MRIFHKPGTPEVLVKAYGRDSFLSLLSPLLSAALVAVGIKGLRLKSEAQVMDEMQTDAAAMARRGYRVASSDEYQIPRLGVSYWKVTYQLVARPKP